MFIGCLSCMSLTYNYWLEWKIDIGLNLTFEKQTHLCYIDFQNYKSVYD